MSDVFIFGLAGPSTGVGFKINPNIETYSDFTGMVRTYCHRHPDQVRSDLNFMRGRFLVTLRTNTKVLIPEEEEPLDRMALIRAKRIEFITEAQAASYPEMSSGQPERVRSRARSRSRSRSRSKKSRSRSRSPMRRPRSRFGKK